MKIYSNRENKRKDTDSRKRNALSLFGFGRGSIIFAVSRVLLVRSITLLIILVFLLLFLVSQFFLDVFLEFDLLDQNQQHRSESTVHTNFDFFSCCRASASFLFASRISSIWRAFIIFDSIWPSFSAFTMARIVIILSCTRELSAKQDNKILPRPKTQNVCPVRIQG